MTTISDGLLVWNGYWHGFWRRLGEWYPSRCKHLFNKGDYPFQNFGLLEHFPAFESDLPLRGGRSLCRNLECCGYDRFKFENIGDVIHERLWLTSMNKSNGRSVPRC